MLTNLRKNLYFSALRIKIQRGLNNGTIVPFEQDLYDRLDNIYFCGATLSIWLKYLQPMYGMPGECEDRSLYIAAGLPNATIVKADLKNMEYKYGKSGSWHFFVLSDGWIYDSFYLYKFRKDVYFDIFKPRNVQNFESDEYKKSISYQEITGTSLEDLQSFNSKKMWFYMGLKGVMAIADVRNDENFKRELNDMLERINYDPKMFNEEFREDVSKLTLDFSAMRDTKTSA